MMGGRRAILHRLDLETMEERNAPSGDGAHMVTSAGSRPANPDRATSFVANLTPSGIIAPLDATVAAGKPNKPIAPRPGSLAPPNPPDPARGKVRFTLSHDGKELDVVGKLSNISNVSAVTLHDLDFPGYSYTDTSVSPHTLTIANYPDQIGPTVEVLLVPGSGSGPVGEGTFNTVIKTGYLVGPLAGKSLSRLVHDMRHDQVYVNVQTNNGVDPAAVPAGPGNFQFGEIRGMVGPQ